MKNLSDIAQQSLRACYHDGKVIASPTHFSDYWARDSFWAMEGMLSLGDYVEARNVLAYFLLHQRDDGSIPRKISLDINFLKYLFGWCISRSKPRPTHAGLIRPFHAMDSEPLFVIATAQYLTETNDINFVEQHYLAIRKAIMWHSERSSEDFVREYFLGSWMDTVFKFGPVLYTNALYCAALKHMAQIARGVGADEDVMHFQQRYKMMRGKLQTLFWQGEYFVDELRLKKRDHFDLAGNLVMAHFGLATGEQEMSLAQKLIDLIEVEGSFFPVASPSQKLWKINPVTHIFGIGDYHSRAHWLWVGVLGLHLLRRTHPHIAENLLADYRASILSQGDVGETYTASGGRYTKWLWKSAHPFAWSSGMLLAYLHRDHI